MTENTTIALIKGPFKCVFSVYWPFKAWADNHRLHELREEFPNISVVILQQNERLDEITPSDRDYQDFLWNMDKHEISRYYRKEIKRKGNFSTVNKLIGTLTLLKSPYKLKNVR